MRRLLGVAHIQFHVVCAEQWKEILRLGIFYW
jgi:hypothetical protein